MAANFDIVDFHKGEGLRFTAALKNRDGAVIDSPATQTVTLRIGATESGGSVVEFSAAPEVTLTEEATGVWTFLIPPESLSAVPENKVFRYNIWSQLGFAAPVLQIKGAIRLKASIE